MGASHVAPRLRVVQGWCSPSRRRRGEIRRAPGPAAGTGSTAPVPRGGPRRRTCSPALMRLRTSSDMSSGSSGSADRGGFGRFVHVDAPRRVCRPPKPARGRRRLARAALTAPHALLSSLSAGSPSSSPPQAARLRAGPPSAFTPSASPPRVTPPIGLQTRSTPPRSRPARPRRPPELKGSLSTTLISGSRSASARMVVDLPVPRSPMIMTPPIWGARAGGRLSSAGLVGARSSGRLLTGPLSGPRFRPGASRA